MLQFTRPQIGGGFTRRSSDKTLWQAAGFKNSIDDWLARDGEVLTEGYIALQAESHGIDFKDIELLDLSR